MYFTTFFTVNVLTYLEKRIIITVLYNTVIIYWRSIS